MIHRLTLTFTHATSSKPEMAPSMETVKAANVTDFTQVAATKQREREEAEDEYPDLEIPAFLRRQAN